MSPIVHEAWAGEPIELPGDSRQVLDPEQLPELAERAGHDIVTSDGTTLLGADDKAGIAEIMAAVAYLAGSPERPRAPIRVAFTVDEEVGRGAEDFDLEAFGADVAYTLDGSGLGELEVETFSAKSMRVTIRGLSVHPGTAKGKLVNAVKLAAELVDVAAGGRLSPETTEGREGYVHPHRIAGNAEEAVVDFIARDHDDALLEEHVALLRDNSPSDVANAEPRAHVEIEVRDSYRNMRPYIEENPARRRGRARGDPPRGRRAEARDHPGRDGRRRALVARAPDPEPLHGRPGVPLGARVGERAGHGRRRGDDRRARRRLGRARVAAQLRSGLTSLRPDACDSSGSTTSRSRSATSTR